MDGEKEGTTEREEREGGMDGEKERVASTGDDATGGAKSRHFGATLPARKKGGRRAAPPRSKIRHRRCAHRPGFEIAWHT